MSNALAQSATQLAQSTSGPDSYDFMSRLTELAKRKLPTNGLTVSSVTMSRSKLISGLVEDYRSHFANLFPKKDSNGNDIKPNERRIPTETYDKICSIVDEFCQAKLDEFMGNPDEVVKSARRFVHKAQQKDVIIRWTVQRDEIISLQQRKLGITLFIGESNRLLDKYNNQKSTWSEETAERVLKLEKRLKNEEATLAVIEMELAKQKAITA